MRRLGLLSLVLLLGLPVGAGCDTRDDGGSQLQELARRQRVLWRDQNIDSYRFVYEAICANCATRLNGPFEVIVRDGVRQHVVYAGDTLGTDSLDLFFTIEALFDFIDEGFSRNPERSSVTFDPELSYPLRVIFDYSLRSAGEEDLVQVNQFEEL